MLSLTKVIGREVLDSRGNPTVEVELHSHESSASAIVPSGASTGSREALELRDGNEERYLGKGVLKAVEAVNSPIASHLIGQEIKGQQDLDSLLIELDGTANKGNLGANAILGVSLAYAKLAALESGIPLYQYFAFLSNKVPQKWTIPVPMMNILNGGKHADNSVDIQEFMVVPHGFTSFQEALRAGTEVFHTLKKILKSKGLSTAVGDEGGFAPQIESSKAVLDLLVQAIEKAGYKPGKEISLALDVAASELYDAQSKKYTSFKGTHEIKDFSEQQLIDYYQDLIGSYPIVSIEDGLSEGDWYGWKMMYDLIGGKVQLVGDDIFVTNPELVAQGIKESCANSVLIKLNQIGTVSETISAVETTMNNGWTAVISHRSGESEDTTIADLAVGLATGQIKTGAPCRSDRVAKYNQLLRIEERLVGKVGFGDGVFKS
ncbi:MAG: phosphopyruvate hydratase [bacterium]